jgi:hypothetical protein
MVQHIRILSEGASNDIDDWILHSLRNLIVFNRRSIAVVPYSAVCSDQ